MRYRREIDGLRALAVLPVILFHAGFNAFSGGFVGVDIFFVISGYLITSIILTDLERGSFSLLNFYERRARRILPALFLVMLVTLPFAWFLMLPQNFKNFSLSLVAVPLFASNILFYLTSGYFNTASEFRPLLHTWSLAVEEQFYILFPFFLMITWKLGKKWIMKLVLFAAVLSIIAAHWGSTRYPSFTFYLLPTRGFEILIGVLISLYTHLKPSIFSFGQVVSQSISLVGLACIFYGIFGFDSRTPSPSLYTLFPTIGTGLILIFANSKNVVGKLLGNKLLVGIGLISYSAYLWHQPLFAFSKIYTLNQNPSWLTALVLLATFFLSILSTIFVENPIRKTNKFSKKMFFLVFIIFSVFFISYGLHGYKKGGITSQHSAKIISLSHAQIDWGYPGDLKKRSGTENLYAYDETRPINILFIGDSHAEQFSPVASYVSSKSGKNVAFLTEGGCPPIPNLIDDKQPQCFGFFEKLESLLKREKNIETVLIGGCFNCYFIDQMSLMSGYNLYFKDGHDKLFLKKGNGFNEAFNSFKVFVNNLSLKMNVVVIGDIPSDENFNPRVLSLANFRIDSKYFKSKYPDFVAGDFPVKNETMMLNHKIKELAESSNASFLNTQEIVCPEGICNAFDEQDQPKYIDRNHMRAVYVSSKFNEVILKKIKW